MYTLVVVLLSSLLSLGNCSGPANVTSHAKSEPIQKKEAAFVQPAAIKTGADQTPQYLPLLKNKRVAMVVNQTSLIGKKHLVDTLLSEGINIKFIFAPEHGFRGDADAGATISNGTDTKTGLPIISLYGKNKKPSADQLKDIDIVVFDIQDVGARFFTYISTMHYVMEACAENNKPLMVLDRPNPTGYYVDGPVLNLKHQSFVGMHPIPIVHGLTVGELAQMINGEKWLAGGKNCPVTIIPAKNYTHKSRYSLPVKPSPNLPNDVAIQIYPSICLFEGTNVSVGRGTETPFQVIGSPFYSKKDFSFTPKSMPGATNPPHLNQVCYGQKFTAKNTPEKFTLAYLLDFYQNSTNKEKFFNNYFTNLAGTTELKEQIIAGKSEAEIKATWQPALQAYKKMRKQYLLYPDFE
ncbi:exo-beta-N-acetylmuramidase NamZ family protein [Adhaeribacter aquaticus]|uniref:exo-beta-N-acetylmuramidase NamZ family protein n=1 Tax=Adhaeribacter aquaticus TaxID=299567 RepID=UPI000424FA5E|nr:DUF1343 domain-containing protein [Adhaeribacter aquaticus]